MPEAAFQMKACCSPAALCAKPIMSIPVDVERRAEIPAGKGAEIRHALGEEPEPPRPTDFGCGLTARLARPGGGARRLRLPRKPVSGGARLGRDHVLTDADRRHDRARELRAEGVRLADAPAM